MFVGHRWAQATSGCNRSIIGWSVYLCTCMRCCIFREFTVISALPEHFNPLYLLFNTVGTSGCSYSSEFEHIPALFNALTTYRFQQGLLHLWLNKAGILNCGTLTKPTFKIQCCRLAGIWVLVLQHCNKVMSTLLASSFSCVINSQDTSSCLLPTVLLGSCRVTFCIWFGLGFPVLQN